MRWSLMVVLPGLIAGCNPREPGEGMNTETESVTSGSSSGSTADAAGTVDSSEVGVEPEPEIDIMEFSRCGGTERDPLCIATDETCICGPACLEYGPAGFPGRCPFGDFAALCPGDFDTPYVCIIPCTVDTDCPDPEMVCRPCPAAFEHACLDLGNFYEGAGLNSGFSMCTWQEE
ncbi:hypothetical protein [Paraliomyxa miuraensis]|uniref:hypothetical protein n=1 Tax=Paraliomyxa miuraensis TaxID=376150 RepID=UPI00224F829E|nr:hypothetical protein [Paraliomyxa miuraensis]MCX4243133.1 hypothetical protein [Paraliomyxa miuraensis]